MQAHISEDFGRCEYPFFSKALIESDLTEFYGCLVHPSVETVRPKNPSAPLTSS
jgi:hypothetical protein